MIPINLPMAELKPALVGLAKVIDRRPTLPILGSIKIERTNDGWITLTSTDLDRFINALIPSKLYPFGKRIESLKPP